MFRRFRNIRLGTRITIIVSLLMIITLAAVGVMSFSSASDALLTSYKTSLITQASQTAELLGKEFVSNRVWMEEIAEEVGRALENKESVKDALEDLNEDRGYTYLGYTGIDKAGAAAEGNALNLSEMAGYQKALEGQTTITRPEVYENDGNLYFYAFAPTFDENENIVGVVSAMIKYEDLYNVVSGIKIGDTGYVVVLDEVGAVAMHPKTDDVRNKTNNTIPQPDKPELNAIVALQQRAVAKETGFGQFNINGTEKFMAFAPVPDADFEVLLSVPKAELFTQIDQHMIMVILSSVISLVVIMAVLLLFVRTQISRPLKKTADFARSLASGNLEAANAVNSKDEVGQLSAILDGDVRQAFLQIERNRLVSEKQANYQTAEVDKLVINLERLSKGELYCDMSVGDADEDTQDVYTLFSNISANLHMSVNAIKGYIKDISSVLGEISAKNLNVEISAEYQGDFVALKDSINGIVQSLNEVMLDINVSADQVASGTQQVSGGSQEISQGATEQASAIEELTASVSQIAEQTRLNAASANEASQLTTSAKRDAEQGNEQMKAMQQAMADINEASASIGKIIKVIDDIAFQTNILALNAAVEAARAGAHGKGFAVVAEEVRNLAARSANAAKETTDLIEGSIRKAEAGTRIASETAGSLANIVRGVEKAAQLVGEIAQASNEQASAIMQVNRGIEQMSLVVQTNSATSEEAAAAAEELSSQAEMLKNMIGQFSLKSGHAEIRTIESRISDETKSQVHLSDSEFGKY